MPKAQNTNKLLFASFVNIVFCATYRSRLSEFLFISSPNRYSSLEIYSLYMYIKMSVKVFRKLLKAIGKSAEQIALVLCLICLLLFEHHAVLLIQ